MYRYSITGTTGTVLDLASTAVSATATACKEPEEKKRCTSPTQTNEKRGSEWYDLAHKDQQSEQRVLADEAKKQLQILRNPPGRSCRQVIYIA
eukprot:COSAG05_NODE_14592_length_392_cov_7.641638_1_plen_93_part_00